MKKFFALAAAVICLIVGTTSCNKSDEVLAQYKFDQQELLTFAEQNLEFETDVENLFKELGDVVSSYNGTSFTESELVSDLDDVIRRYDNNNLAGTFSLYKALGESKNFSKCHTWTMKKAN